MYCEKDTILIILEKTKIAFHNIFTVRKEKKKNF